LSQKVSNEVWQLKARVESLETALQVLLRQRVESGPQIDAHPTIVKIKDDIQGIKMRLGRIPHKETA